MPKEYPKPSFENIPQRLSPQEIEEILKKFPEVSLDKGKQHFMIEQKNQDGEWQSTEYIPVWKKIPHKDGVSIPIAEEIMRSLTPAQEKSHDTAK